MVDNIAQALFAGYLADLPGRGELEEWFRNHLSKEGELFGDVPTQGAWAAKELTLRYLADEYVGELPHITEQSAAKKASDAAHIATLQDIERCERFGEIADILAGSVQREGLRKPPRGAVLPDTNEYLALQVLLENHATSHEKRMTTDDLAQKVNNSTGNDFKWVVTKLRHKGLVETRPGRGGGVWLTSAGRTFATEMG